MSLRSRVAIVGAGMVPFGELFEQSYEDMAVGAFRAALADSRAAREDIEAAWLGTFRQAQSTGASLVDPLRLYPRPCTRVENACATGADAFRNAVFGVASGAYRLVAVAGVEKTRDRGPREGMQGLAEGGRHPIWATGLTTPGYFALYATRHMKMHGTTREQMARVAVKNHRNGAHNPYAHLRFEVTLDRVLNAPQVASPLGLLDCCPTTDGAACLLLAHESVARKYSEEPIWVAGLGQGTDTLWFGQKPDYTGFQATRQAAHDAYAMAGVGPGDLDVAEVHDCFTITEIINYEDLGFCPPGDGGKHIESGAPDPDGDLPVNPSGGLKSRGHPIGATGVAQLCELTWQLRGRADKRQVPGARTGLAHTLGGAGQVSNVTILQGET
ncbi:MAG: thiolase family protein [Euryarchaeota archaeon]|nr:thiolase family protein [Euryarchaeota archaeon]